jgi:hypothetical protein
MRLPKNTPGQGGRVKLRDQGGVGHAKSKKHKRFTLNAQRVLIISTINLTTLFRHSEHIKFPFTRGEGEDEGIPVCECTDGFFTTER